MKLLDRHPCEGTQPVIHIGHRVYKRKDGSRYVSRTWYAEWCLTGKHRQWALGTTNKNVAIRKAHDLCRQIENGQSGPKVFKINNKEMAKQYLELKANEGRSPKTIEKYTFGLHSFADWAEGTDHRSAVGFGSRSFWKYVQWLRDLTIEKDDFEYLLFIKMADERGVELPKGCSWPELEAQSGTALTDHYADALRTLGKQPGILGDIFSGSMPRFNNPVNLKKLISLIDETEWTSLDKDVKAEAFEGLLEKAASEGKKGAGQFFTPRPLIQSICEVMKPDPRPRNDITIYDPAVGTAGFLVCAYEWLLAQTKGAFDRDVAKRIKTKTYYGQELVPRPRRLALKTLTHCTIVFLIALAVCSVRASAEDQIQWQSAEALEIEGIGWPHTAGPFQRLPDSAKEKVNSTAWDLSKNSAGIAVRFTTDAAAVSVRWSLTSASLAMPHMPATGCSGLDLYARAANGAWKFIGNGRPHRQDGNESKIEFAEGAKPKRECIVYLPLYNGTKSLEIGVPAGSRIDKPTARPEGLRKPIVVIRPDAHPTERTLDQEFAVQSLQKEGVQGLLTVAPDDFIGDDGEGTVDGVHYTDIGMQRQAQSLFPIVSKVLGEAAAPKQ